MKHHSARKESLQQGVHFVLPLSLFFLLLVGIFISLIQLQHQQTSQSQASIQTITPAVSIQNCDATTDQLTIKPQEQTFFDQINTYRQQHGLAPLLWSTDLKRAAAWMSDDMLVHGSLSHIDSAGRDMQSRIEDCGFSGSSVFGENIDSGSSSDYTPVLSAWENAPAQNANLLNNVFTQAAIALASNTANSYWVLDLAAVIPTPTVQPTSILSLSPTKPQIPTLTQSPTLSVVPTLLPTGTPYPTMTPMPTLPTRSTPVPFTPPANTLIPTPTQQFITNPNDMQVFVSIKLPGIGHGGNTAPEHLTRHVQITLYDTSNQPAGNGSGYLQFTGDLFQGIIHLGKFANGTYYIKIAGDNTLQALVMPEFQILQTSRLNVLPTVSLVQGDLDGDDVLDINDYNLALACFQDNNCQTKNLLDFNDDGKTDIVDYNLLLQNFLQYSGD